MDFEEKMMTTMMLEETKYSEVVVVILSHAYTHTYMPTKRFRITCRNLVSLHHFLSVLMKKVEKKAASKNF